MGRQEETDVYIPLRPLYILPTDNSTSVNFHVSLVKNKLLGLQLPSLNTVSAKDSEIPWSGYPALHCVYLLSSSKS